MVTLTLYLRGGCSLCEAFLSELMPLQSEYGFSLRIEEIDRRPEWFDRYAQLIPVLEDQEGNELCHYYVDPERLKAYFATL